MPSQPTRLPAGRGLTRAAVLSLAVLTMVLALLATTGTRPPPAGPAAPATGAPVLPAPALPAPTTATPTPTTTTLGPEAFDHGPAEVYVYILFAVIGAAALFVLLGLLTVGWAGARGAMRGFRLRVRREEVTDPGEALPAAAAPTRDRPPPGVHRRDLARGSVREAVIATWADVEDAAEDSGFGRAQFETPSQFARRIVRVHGVEAAPLRVLLGLFNEARFSEHELPERARREAADAAERLELDLATSRVDAGGGS